MGELTRLLRAVRLWTALCAVLAAAPAAAADCRFFVRAGFVPDGGPADGRSPERAFATIAEGVAAVDNADDVVCVGPGLYVEGDIGPARSAPATQPIVIRGDDSGASTDDPPGTVRIVPPTGLPPELTPGTAFRILGRQGLVIEGFEISGFRDAGIQVRSATIGGENSSDVTIRDIDVRQCRTGIDVFAEGVIVVENVRAVANTATGISVQSCEVPDEFGTCRGLPSLPVVPIVSNNRSGGNGAHGLFLRAGENAVVQNNVLYSNAFTGVSLRGVPDALVANNLVYRNGEEGIAVGSGFLSPTGTMDPAELASPNVIVLNNTIYENGQWGLEIGNSLAASPGGAVVNNIAWRNGAGRLGIGVLNERGQAEVRKPSVCGYVAGFNNVLDEYGPDTPRNAYDLRIDPLFVDPEGADGVAGGEVVDGVFIDRSADDDFRLRQSGGQLSPAVDAGSTTTARLGLSGSTAGNGAADTGTVDLGFHYGASAEQMVVYEMPFMPLYVRSGGADIDDGMTPATAFATIGTAARRARAGISVIVGPGVYRECDLTAPPDSGRAFFVADPSGERTLDLPGVTLVDPGKCYYDPVRQEFDPGQTGFNVGSVCGAVVDGFHITGASDDGIQLQNASDGSVIRNNVLFANAKRGINVANSDDVRIVNNLAYRNNGGIQIGSGARPLEACASSGANRAVLEFNTVYNNTFDGILLGAGVCPSADPAVRYNVTGENGQSSGEGAGIEVGTSAREGTLAGYVSAYNLVADRYAASIPRAASDLLIDLAVEPLYLEPTAIVVAGDWRMNRHFRLVQRAAGQSAQTRAVGFSDQTALQAGLSTRSTRSDGIADDELVDLGYHYPAGGELIGDCDGDGVVTVNELVTAVNIALGNAPLTDCPSASSDGQEVTISDLIQAVNSALESQS